MSVATGNKERRSQRRKDGAREKTGVHNRIAGESGLSSVIQGLASQLGPLPHCTLASGGKVTMLPAGPTGFEPALSGLTDQRVIQATPRPRTAHILPHPVSSSSITGPEESPNILPFLNAIVVGDAEDVLRLLPSDSVDMVLTSPPYNFGHSYDSDPTGDTLSWEEYFAKLYRIWAECYRILKPGGRIAVNILPMFSDYVPTHHIISWQLQQLGFLWRTEIIWEKNHWKAKYTTWGSWLSPSSPYIKCTWEFIEVFDKITHRKTGARDAIDITADEFKKWTVGRWSIAPETRAKKYGHPAMFPEEIPYRLMRLFTFRGDVIVDPFNGAGTTTVVAYRLRRRFVGIDISRVYCQTAYERILEAASEKTGDYCDDDYPPPQLICSLPSPLHPDIPNPQAE